MTGAPVFTGGMGQLEVPQVFQVGDLWYCLFCTASIHWSDQYRRDNPQSPVTGTHYLIGDHPRGPWRIAPGPFLDGDEPCRRYAARIVDGPQGLVIMGFADGGKDVFVHITAVQRSGIPELSENMKISFEVQPDKKGRGPQAVELQIV